MDGRRIQEKVDRGHAIAASRLGQPHRHYRPSGPADPVADANLVGDLPASFSPDNHRYRRPQGHGKAAWTGLWDGSRTAAGDYLVAAADGTSWFIASQDPLLPMQAIRCNALVDILRPGAAAGFGALPGYGGDIVDGEAALLTGWPASMLDDGRGDGGGVGLPGDVKQPAAELLLPALSGVDLAVADTVNDNLGRRWKVTSAERTSLGWRARLALATA